jgi:Tol biopolymer transport system component/DNA-binding winged helix-turn-helix (wHTH) protein
MTGNRSDRARFDPFEVDLNTHELWKFGTKLKLVGQPFEILAVLLSKPGELVTREELRNRLWPSDTFVDFNHGLNAAVNKLRETLSDSAEQPRYVETLPRRGYRFIAAVEWQDAKPATLAVSAPVDPPATVLTELPRAVQPPAGAETETAERKRGWPRYLMGASVLLGLAFLGILVLKTISRYGEAFATRSPAVQQTRLLTNVADISAPAFSPDGNSVAFFHEGAEAGEAGIFVTVVGSDQLVQLTSYAGDCCPVWSPDGRAIAFSRFANKEFAIYVVPADGGAEQERNAEKTLATKSATYKLKVAGTSERKLDTSGVVPRHGELSWSPDGKSIAFAGGAGIYLLSLENTAVRRLTEPPPLSQDWGPVFSPDGQKVLFVRNRAIGLPDEIWDTSAAGGDAARILSERGRIVSPAQWSFDGRAIVFSSNRSGHPTLWRVSLDAPNSAFQIGEAGSPAWDPAVSRRGYRLAYERLMRSLSIWQMDLSPSGDKRPRILVSSTSDTDQGPGPQFSPDGQKLAYMSDRSGTMEIWVSSRNGSNPFQLTAVGGAGTPRWSPDSQAIVFDVHTTNGNKIVSINLRGGAPQVFTPDSFDGECPSWSRDGRWIYFASDHGGTRQVWKVPAAGGSPVQVTQQGGHAGLESPDGKILYYAKNAMAEPEIWQVPVEGGLETPLPLVRPGTWASWQVVDGGILFIGPSLGHRAVLNLYDFAKQRTTSVAVLDRVPFWLGATPDGRIVAFDQPGQEQAQAMLVENFR